MLGHRGCRLAITYPEICAMQARAIFEAAVRSLSRTLPIPEIMVPLAGTAKEIEICRQIIDVAAEFAEKGQKIDYLVGTMAELPRAALVLTSWHIQPSFLFGTNDLTQTALGISRVRPISCTPMKSRAFTISTPLFPLMSKGCQLVKMGADRGRQTRRI